MNTKREAEFRAELAHCDYLGYDSEETVRYLAETFPEADTDTDEYGKGYDDGYEEGYRDGDLNA